MTTATRLGLIAMVAGGLLSAVGWVWFALKPAPEADAYAPGGIALGGDTFCIVLGSLWLIAGTFVTIAGILGPKPRQP